MGERLDQTEIDALLQSGIPAETASEEIVGPPKPECRKCIRYHIIWRPKPTRDIVRYECPRAKMRGSVAALRCEDFHWVGKPKEEIDAKQPIARQPKAKA